MKTLDDIKRDVYAHIPKNEVSDSMNLVIDYLHAKGLLMVWNTDMDSAPRDGKCLWGVFESGKWYVTLGTFGKNFNGSYPLVPTGFRQYELPTHWMPLPPAPTLGEGCISDARKDWV